jgi:hypothetical protein
VILRKIEGRVDSTFRDEWRMLELPSTVNQGISGSEGQVTRVPPYGIL